MKNLIIAIISLIFILTVSCVFIIYEGQRGIVFEFSKIKRDSVTDEMMIFEPGLHFKIPFIQSV
ncbi:MAG: membrane protease subunit HflC, partial [Colwellia sp.]